MEKLAKWRQSGCPTSRQSSPIAFARYARAKVDDATKARLVDDAIEVEGSIKLFAYLLSKIKNTENAAGAPNINSRTITSFPQQNFRRTIPVSRSKIKQNFPFIFTFSLRNCLQFTCCLYNYKFRKSTSTCTCICQIPFTKKHRIH